MADGSRSHFYLILLSVLAVCSASYFAFTGITTYFRRRQIKKQNGCEPPPRYPHGLLGLDFIRATLREAERKKMLDTSRARFDKMGGTYSATLSLQPMIFTHEPDNIKTVLSIKFKDYNLGNRKNSLGPLLGEGIFTTSGEHWHSSRSMIRPNFARDQVADLGAFERHFKLMLRKIPRDGSTVNLQDLFFLMTIDSATEFLFGESVHALKADASTTNGFAEAFNHAQNMAARRIRAGKFAVFFHGKGETEAIKFCHEFVDQFVDQAVEYRRKLDEEDKGAVDEKYVFLYELAKTTKDKKRLRDELFNVLLAGRDTTASLLSNMFFEIAKRPDIWEKLQAEVAQLNGEIPSYETLRNMKYLKYCMNESLRIHPVVPLNSRLAVKDTVLPRGGGADGKSPVFVEKGALVSYSVYSMHHRKDIYGPDADEFRPERWEALRPSWEYLPFNGGPRICLGQQYALTEAGFVTTRILQEFKGIESRDPGPWVESLSLTLSSHGGTNVSLTPR